MAEADIGIYIATAGALAIRTAIQFGERAYRISKTKREQVRRDYGVWNTNHLVKREKNRKKSTPNLILLLNSYDFIWFGLN